MEAVHFYTLPSQGKHRSLLPGALCPPDLCLGSVPADFGKRVYQGVRVKHTVKDLLAEKRSRQGSASRFTGSTSTAQSPFGQMPGSPTTAGYYGGRRSFPAELDFHSSKQCVSDVYPSSLGSKPFSCDPSAPQGYPALLEPYLSEHFGDHRAAPPPLPAAASSFFSAAAVPPLLPPFPSDTGHLLLVTRAASPFRGSGWTPALPGAQPYPLHPLEDAHYSPSYAATSPYSLSPFVARQAALAPFGRRCGAGAGLSVPQHRVPGEALPAPPRDVR
nr:uncharacterized protein C11orf53 homolog [Taeniopygia guttata]